jgi:hypothetical protein
MLKKPHFRPVPPQNGRVRKLLIASFFISLSTIALAQDGKAGITQATTLITGYFDTGITLLYAIGAVVGLVGAVKVYNAWTHGEQNTNKLAASWFGACIFLVVVAAVLKSFFGVN